MKKLRKSALLLLLAAVLTLLPLSACTDKTPPAEESSEESLPDEESGFINPLDPPEGPEPGMELDDLKSLAESKYKQNEDTIGWLRLPGTTVDDVVVFYPNDPNVYYLRRDFEKNSNQYGTYFVDFRCTFNDDYTWQGLSTNTCIYGHSMDDNPDGKAFSQLKKYLNEDFARENPNFYFSTLGEDMVFEVFSVFYATTNHPYNMPEWPNFDQTLNDVLERSIYNYDVDVTKDDKIVTLSTCCYNYVATYPNEYRFVIMAKLVKPGEEVKEEAVFQKNPSPKAP